MSGSLVLPGDRGFEAVYEWAHAHQAEFDPPGSNACEVGMGSLALTRALASPLHPEFSTHEAITEAVENAHVEHPAWQEVMEAKEGQSVPFGGKILHDTIPGMGKVIDWRKSGWSEPNGGHIPVLLFVDHIPVLPNSPGFADFIRLRNVLVAQGLMVHASTDAEGNVALFTDFDRRNNQARGANGFSAGCEHMHASLTERWTEKQRNAASYVHWFAKEHYGVPAHAGRIAAGSGIVRVLESGHVTHEDVARKAGYNDRSDPGALFVRLNQAIYHGVIYFDHHHNFKGYKPPK